MAKHEKIKKMAGKMGWNQKGGINEKDTYCNHCASSQHKSHQHAALVRSGKITR